MSSTCHLLVKIVFLGRDSMHICFGVVASILNCCRKGINQSDFIARIAYCLDKKSSYFTENYSSLENKKEIKGDDPAANKLLRCKRDYVLYSKDIPYAISLSDVIKDFETYVQPWIDEDQKPAIILALLDIIGQDTKIDFEKKNTFMQFMGIECDKLLRQDTFAFSDFLCRLLLYSVGSNIPNTTDQSFISSINKNFILNTKNLYKNEYQWDSETQTLVLTFQITFDTYEHALHTHSVKDFIEKVDPSNCLNFVYVEKSEDFIKHIQCSIHTLFGPFALANPGFIVQKLQEFTETLDDYTYYLGINMRLADPIDSMNFFVPIFRDENALAALDFVEKTRNYRKQLVSIHQEICAHMIFNAKYFPREQGQSS